MSYDYEHPVITAISFFFYAAVLGLGALGYFTRFLDGAIFFYEDAASRELIMKTVSLVWMCLCSTYLFYFATTSTFPMPTAMRVILFLVGIGAVAGLGFLVFSNCMSALEELDALHPESETFLMLYKKNGFFIWGWGGISYAIFALGIAIAFIVRAASMGDYAEVISTVISCACLLLSPLLMLFFAALSCVILYVIVCAIAFVLAGICIAHCIAASRQPDTKKEYIVEKNGDKIYTENDRDFYDEYGHHYGHSDDNGKTIYKDK